MSDGNTRNCPRCGTQVRFESSQPHGAGVASCADSVTAADPAMVDQ